MNHPRRGKSSNRRQRSNRAPQQQQQRPSSNAGTQRSVDAFITDNQRTRLARLGERSHSTTCPLTISTRGIGLAISRVTSVMRQLIRPGSGDIPVAEIYRSSLAQLHAKMSYTGMRGYRHDLGFKYAPSSYSNWARSYVISHRRDNLSQVALIINSIGKVEVNGKNFVPVFSKETNALNIRLDNLREYCERMSKPETDSSERIQGYELNSIPNAKWERLDENDEKSIVLTNPDEIIPPDYDWKTGHCVFKDLDVLSEWFYEVYEILSYYRGFDISEWQATINDNNEGDPGMLVSTHVIPGQSLKLDNEVISGSQSQFWSPEPISHASWCVGAFGLVGEVLNSMDGSARSNVGPMRAVVDWHQISGMTV